MKSLKKESYEAIRTNLLPGSLNEQARIDALRIVYETQSRKLRDLVVFATLDAVQTPKLDETKLELLIKTMPDLGWDFFRTKNLLEGRLRCDNCARVYKLGSKELKCYCAFQVFCSRHCDSMFEGDFDRPGCQIAEGFGWERGQTFRLKGELVVT